MFRDIFCNCKHARGLKFPPDGWEKESINKQTYARFGSETHELLKQLPIANEQIYEQA
jgi:hypothetical protein